jgi:hypothetical protein
MTTPIPNDSPTELADWCDYRIGLCKNSSVRYGTESYFAAEDEVVRKLRRIAALLRSIPTPTPGGPAESDRLTDAAIRLAAWLVRIAPPFDSDPSPREMDLIGTAMRDAAAMIRRLADRLAPVPTDGPGRDPQPRPGGRRPRCLRRPPPDRTPADTTTRPGGNSARSVVAIPTPSRRTSGGRWHGCEMRMRGGSRTGRSECG